MDGATSVVPGLIAAVAIGVGGGLGLGLLREAPKPSTDRTDAAPVPLGARHLTVETSSGTVEVLDLSETWNQVVAGQAVELPVRARVRGGASVLALSGPSFQVVASSESDFVVERRAGKLAVRLLEGRVVLEGSEATETSMSARGVSVVGTSYLVWGEPTGPAKVASFGGQTRVIDAARGAVELSVGQAAVSSGEKTSQLRLPDRLEVKVDKVWRPAPHRRFRFEGRTDPSVSLVHLFKGQHLPVELGPGGEFTVLSWNQAPAPAELVATDVLGRRAEPGRPSESLEEVLADIKGGRGAPRSRTTPR